MPLTKKRRYALLRALDREYLRLDKTHRQNAPENGTIPVGGGDWMDTFFKMEAIRGTITALRNGKSLRESIEEGCDVSVISVKIWNDKREWQVHRCKKTAFTFLRNRVYGLLRETT